MKKCTRCGLYMIDAFKGCPHCQTDKYIIKVVDANVCISKTKL